MKNLSIAVSSISLAVVAILPLVFLLNEITLATMQTWLLVSTAGWFFTAPFWMRGK